MITIYIDRGYTIHDGGGSCQVGGELGLSPAPALRDIIAQPMDEIIFLVEESPEGGYEARALGEAIFTEAETLPELKERVRDAVRCHFDEARRPRIIRLHLVKDELILV